MAGRYGVERRYTVKELANALGRSTRTIRRLLRPYRAECSLVRDGRSPRRVLSIPEHVAKRIEKALMQERVKRFPPRTLT